jgi:hypothetical protein
VTHNVGRARRIVPRTRLRWSLAQSACRWCRFRPFGLRHLRRCVAARSLQSFASTSLSTTRRQRWPMFGQHHSPNQQRSVGASVQLNEKAPTFGARVGAQITRRSSFGGSTGAFDRAGRLCTYDSNVIRRFDLPMAYALTLVIFRFARFVGAGLCPRISPRGESPPWRGRHLFTVAAHRLWVGD